jgi:hypothetical protein
MCSRMYQNLGFEKYIFGVKKLTSKKGPFHATPQYTNTNSHSNRNTISDDNTTCNINVQMSLLKSIE